MTGSRPRLAFAEVSLGDELPELSKVVTREDVKAYADSSGDDNPLHQDDEFARSRGFDAIIAHGMFTMAHLTTCLSNWAGDPLALTHIKAAFRATVSMGETMVAGAKVVDLDAETRRATLDVWVTVERDGAAELPIKRSRAEVQLG
jgi:acyl dehydratase